MKQYKLILFAFFVFIFSSCEENLDTLPTDQASGSELFSDADKAMSTINGLYRAMYMTGWGTGWEHEQFGHVAATLSGSLMADDMLQHEGGQGWFWFDYAYQVKSDYTNTQGRPYSTWNFYYTIITNVNSIIAEEETISGSPSKINSLIGQAYALRAFAYFNLARFYQQTYVGNTDLPGVPIYTEPTTIATEGVGRGTLADVYTQVNSDIDIAIEKLDPAEADEKLHISNIDYYSANGIKARIMLEQARWQDAYDAANEAMSGSTDIIPALTLEKGFAFNDVTDNSVLWGFEIIDDQVPAAGYASFFAHTDASSNFYANTARVCVSSWLYDQVDSVDVRKSWWNGPLAEEDEKSTGDTVSYNQFKFKFSNKATGSGDYIFMRHEEMMLIQAEAKCMLTEYGDARTILETLMTERNPEYDISTLTNDKTLTTDDINGPTTPTFGSVTLLDEIILQRRIELWGETSRIYDIKRLKTGFTRYFEDSNHTRKLSEESTLNILNPEWVMSIPQAEFDGNDAMDATRDQNPW